MNIMEQFVSISLLYFKDPVVNTTKALDPRIRNLVNDELIFYAKKYLNDQLSEHEVDYVQDYFGTKQEKTNAMKRKERHAKRKQEEISVAIYNKLIAILEEKII